MNKTLLIATLTASIIGVSYYLTREAKVTTYLDLVTAINEGQDVIVNADTIDLTGYHSLLLRSDLNLNGAVVLARDLFNSDTLFTFIMDGGKLHGGTIIGANGNCVASGGFYGAVRVRTSGKIEDMTFLNCDKWAIDVRGIRNRKDDITTIDRCVFSGTKRDGYGYSVWNQGGTVRINACKFDNGRHFLDGGSEAGSYEVTGCEFGYSYNYPINLHLYNSNKSGAGFLFTGNRMYGTYEAFKLYYPFSGVTFIDQNHLAGSKVGTIGGDSLVGSEYWGNNTVSGMGLLPAPVLNISSPVKVGSQPTYTLSGYKSYVWSEPLPKRFGSPQVRLYSVYGTQDGVRSLSATRTVVVSDTGQYFGIWVKSHGVLCEVVQGGVVTRTVKPTSDWVQVFVRGVAKLRLTGVGTVYLDDFTRTSETFEVTNKIKVILYGEPAKSARFSGESHSGEWSFRIVKSSGGVVEVE